MRSMLEVICAVKDCEPVTEEELKLCVCCLAAKLHFAEHERDKLVELIEENKPKHLLDFRVGCIKREKEIAFKSSKMPMDEYLGPRNTPGTPEQKVEMKWAKDLFEKATGQKI